MSDVIAAIVERLDTAANAYTAVGGRVYRGQAPVNVARPFIVLSYVAGTILRVFNGKHLEQYHVQADVVADFNSDATDARDIWDKLVADLEGDALDVGTDTHIKTERITLPRETIDDNLIDVSGDWLVEIQKA